MINPVFPDFELASTGNKAIRFPSSTGKILIIYFYPKDNTPGCTSEGQQFRDLYPEFSALGCAIYGISRDSLQSHENFKAKMNFPFDLLSDTEEKACEQFNVIKMKNRYGRQLRGIERSTFVFDAKGVLQREWRSVQVPGHAQEVLDYVRTLR